MSEQDTLTFKVKRLERLIIIMLRDLGVYKMVNWLAKKLNG